MKRVAMAILSADDADAFHESEEADNGSREACFACQEAYELLSTSEKEEKQRTEAQAWTAYQAIPSADYWGWLRLNLLTAQPRKLESSCRFDYVDAVLRRQRDPPHNSVTVSLIRSSFPFSTFLMSSQFVHS